MTNKTLTVGTSAVQIREAKPPLWAYVVTEGATVYWGHDASISTSTGSPMPSGSQTYWDKRFENKEIYLISDTASTDVRLSETPK